MSYTMIVRIVSRDGELIVADLWRLAEIRIASVSHPVRHPRDVSSIQAPPQAQLSLSIRRFARCISPISRGRVETINSLHAYDDNEMRA